MSIPVYAAATPMIQFSSTGGMSFEVLDRVMLCSFARPFTFLNLLTWWWKILETRHWDQFICDSILSLRFLGLSSSLWSFQRLGTFRDLFFPVSYGPYRKSLSAHVHLSDPIFPSPGSWFSSGEPSSYSRWEGSFLWISSGEENTSLVYGSFQLGTWIRLRYTGIAHLYCTEFLLKCLSPSSA